ncbi:hypothetical protein C8N36_1025 [Pelagimonas varians]|uniref:Uncharacterized protein n=1 Tax=Pelagimonas varians TaxID=696760 RepID=A0A238JXT6_9RHOB|nr:hypothetical protein C8N36_1025 [Pelagimonas varians]SMX35459.1 hypothetical protein PEV8663_00467 [Pelagimonas varians]
MVGNIVKSSATGNEPRLPRFEDPEFINRQAQIISPCPEPGSDEVAREVTDVIENGLQQLLGVKKVGPLSSPDVSEVIVEFTIASVKNRAELYHRFAQMRAKIDDVQSSLPPTALKAKFMMTSATFKRVSLASPEQAIRSLSRMIMPNSCSAG